MQTVGVTGHSNERALGRSNSGGNLYSGWLVVQARMNRLAWNPTSSSKEEGDL